MESCKLKVESIKRLKSGKCRVKNLHIQLWKHLFNIDFDTSPLSTFQSPLFKKAFTLAEVLITLGVIGVVAALTMPTLVAKYREKATVTAVKEAYSIFSQAYLRVVGEYDDLTNLVYADDTRQLSSSRMFDELSKYIKLAKKCNSSGDKCFADTYYDLSDSKTFAWFNTTKDVAKGVLANGTSFWILSSGFYDGQIIIDINGHKLPNRLGVDTFWFNVLKNGKVVPGNIYGLEYCNLNLTTYELNGYGCTAWLLEHENMDYLKNSIDDRVREQQ